MSHTPAVYYNIFGGWMKYISTKNDRLFYF